MTEQNIFLGEYCTISPREVQKRLIKISLKETIKRVYLIIGNVLLILST